jgi:acetyl esterase/lipase
MEAIRAASAPGKGHIDRAPFDEVLEQTPNATGVTYETGVGGGVQGVWCRPAGARKGAVILYLHGGAYVAGTARAFRHLAGHIASRGGTVAFVPDYRLAPEHRFPAPVEDARAVYRGLTEHGTSAIAIVGDSAGGGLALALLSIAQAEALAEGGLAPCAGAAMSPWVDLALAGSSLKDRGVADPFLTVDALTRAAEQYWLVLSSVGNLIVSTLLAVLGILMAPLPWAVVGAVLAAAVAFAVVLDVLKVPLFKRMKFS